MLKQTLKIVSYLVFSVLIGIAVTLLADSTEDATVEKRIRSTVEGNINNAVASFKESAVHPSSRDEENFIIKFVDTVMADKAVVRERASDRLPGTADQDLSFLFTLSGTDYSLDVYLRQKFLKSELALLDLPDYIIGIMTTIVVFSFTVYFTENKKRTLLMKQQFESKHAELHSALERQEALALVGRMSAALAHELKTPIGTISNLVQALPSRHTDEQFIKRFMTLTGEELNRTQQLIDNLLVYGKDIDILNEEWIPIKSFFTEAVHTGLLLEIPDNYMIYGDKFYLGLLFKNLIRNSREAAARKMRVNVRIHQEKTALAEIVCEDDGNGFPLTADLEKLTAPFVTSRSRGGGLGLYLSKKVVMAHSGSLSLARMEKGARVVITVPLKRIKT
jgi:signal transduction histidine kinase